MSGENMMKLAGEIALGCARYGAGCFCNECMLRELETTDIVPRIEKAIGELSVEREAIRRDLREKFSKVSEPTPPPLKASIVERIMMKDLPTEPEPFEDE